MIIDSLTGGGAEKVAITLSKGLHEQGANITIISLKKIASYELPEFVSVKYLLKDEKESTRGWFKKPVLVNGLQNLIMQIEQDEGKFDLFLVNLYESYRLVSELNLQNVYYVIHNSYIQELKREAKLGPIKYLYMKSILKRLSGKQLIAVSKGVQTELLASTLFTPQSVTHIYNPFDVSDIQRLSQLKQPECPASNYILHVGRAAKAKRHDVLFKALKSVDEKYKLVCLSSNPKKLAKLAAKIGVVNRVILLDFQANPYVWMKNAEAVILSSDFEGLSMVLIEALICQTVIVSTDCPHGPNEVLQGGLKHFLVPVNNPDALSVAINAALQYELQEPDLANIENVTLKSITQQYLSLTH
jgi:glycosyltransferase involved in cell wall biosynthesis